MALARVSIKSHSQAQALQDLAAERCSMSYRPPELFQVNSKCDIDERSDVWVSDKRLCLQHISFLIPPNHPVVPRLPVVCPVLLQVSLRRSVRARRLHRPGRAVEQPTISPGFSVLHGPAQPDHVDADAGDGGEAAFAADHGPTGRHDGSRRQASGRDDVMILSLAHAHCL